MLHLGPHCDDPLVVQADVDDVLLASGTTSMVSRWQDIIILREFSFGDDVGCFLFTRDVVVINLMNYSKVITLTHSMHMCFAAFDHVNTTPVLFLAIFAIFFESIAANH